ncbi:ArsR/SmtB family transcription factor [Nocardioides sambongensis]|uniref:ArsR/SmtB family transcription factor n=1 Tax=Nocardioides sambongensis TaxID=2589074 RepID=UPI001E3CA176|nr:metalloregulator ArsR/SmtB family transcription factor [Nocardioides sambongensis]
MSMSGAREAAPEDALACCTPLAREPMTADQAAHVAPLLKALADPVRLRLMSMVLSRENGEACACDLLPAFDLSQPTISHHLKVLHESGLLNREKRGVWVYYQVRPAAMEAMVTLFTTAGLAPAEVAVGIGAPA